MAKCNAPCIEVEDDVTFSPFDVNFGQTASARAAGTDDPPAAAPASPACPPTATSAPSSSCTQALDIILKWAQTCPDWQKTVEGRLKKLMTEVEEHEERIRFCVFEDDIHRYNTEMGKFAYEQRQFANKQRQLATNAQFELDEQRKMMQTLARDNVQLMKQNRDQRDRIEHLEAAMRYTSERMHWLEQKIDKLDWDVWKQQPSWKDWNTDDSRYHKPYDRSSGA